MSLVPLDDPQFVNRVISRCNVKNDTSHEAVEDAIREELELHPNITVDNDDYHYAVTAIKAEIDGLHKEH